MQGCAAGVAPEQLLTSPLGHDLTLVQHDNGVHPEKINPTMGHQQQASICC